MTTRHLVSASGPRPGRLTFDVEPRPWIESELSAVVFYARNGRRLVKCGVTARLLSTRFGGEGLNPFHCFSRHEATIRALLQEAWTRSGPGRNGVVLLD